MSFSRLPKISQLAALQAIVQYGSFNAAAQALSMSQSSLTRSIQELETVVGAQLLIRGKRGSTLTSAGMTFASQASFLLEGLTRAMNDAAGNGSGADQIVRFGFSPISAHSVTSPALGFMMKEFPRCRFHVDDNSIERNIEQIRTGFLDFAIGNVDSGISLSDFDTEPLFECPFYIVCAKSNPLAGATSLLHLKDANWWVTGEHRIMERKNLEFLLLNMKKSLSTRSFIVGMPMVLHNGYLALLSAVQLNKYIDDLCILPIPNFEAVGRFSIVRMKNVPLSAPAERLISHLHYAADHYDWALKLRNPADSASSDPSD